MTGARSEPAPDALISAQSLTKRFGDFVAVDGIDFVVQRGEAFGLLVPHGAGLVRRTTLEDLFLRLTARSLID